MASQITSLTIVYSTVYSGPDQRKHQHDQSSAFLTFVLGIHRRPVNSPHEWPVMRKMFPFYYVIMYWCLFQGSGQLTSYNWLIICLSKWHFKDSAEHHVTWPHASLGFTAKPWRNVLGDLAASVRMFKERNEYTYTHKHYWYITMSLDRKHSQISNVLKWRRVIIL